MLITISAFTISQVPHQFSYQAILRNADGTVKTNEPVGPTDAATKDYIDKTLEAYGIILPGNYAGTITDIDGNTCRTVTIGTQTWMAENLRVGRTNDDVEIRFFEDDALWNETHSPAYCWYRNDFHCKDVYGLLYNWYAVDCGSLCPAGWHVPTNGDWETLLTYLGDIAMAGGKLKEKGTANLLAYTPIPETTAIGGRLMSLKWLIHTHGILI